MTIYTRSHLFVSFSIACTLPYPTLTSIPLLFLLCLFYLFVRLFLFLHFLFFFLVVPSYKRFIRLEKLPFQYLFFLLLLTLLVLLLPSSYNTLIYNLNFPICGGVRRSKGGRKSRMEAKENRGGGGGRRK